MPATSPHPLPSYLSSLSPLDNPFLASEQHWTATAWPTPSTGFKPRLIILGCLLLIMLVSSLGNIVLMAISASRRGEKLWAVRLVKRENGRYIVLPHILLTSVSPVLYFVPLIGSVYSAWDVYYNHASELWADVWRLWTWILFFVSGWLLTCGSLQAYSLVGGDRRLHLTPRRLNALFLGVLTVVGVTMLVFFGRGVRISHMKADRFTALETFTHAQALAWNGTTDATAFETMLSLTREYAHTSHKFEGSFTRLLAVYCGVLILVLTTNCATFAVVFLLRRQIGESIDMLDMAGSLPSSSPTGSLEVPPAPTTTRHETPPRTPLSPSGRGPTRSDIEKLAASESSMVEKEQARRILKLQMAEKGLKISCITICTFVTCIFVIILWTLITFKSLDGAPWSHHEASLLLPGWLCSILFGASQSFRLVKGWQTLPPKRGVMDSAPEGTTRSTTATMLGGGGGLNTADTFTLSAGMGMMVELPQSMGHPHQSIEIHVEDTSPAGLAEAAREEEDEEKK